MASGFAPGCARHDGGNAKAVKFFGSFFQKRPASLGEAAMQA
jgi:hypothetical protein